MALILPNGEEHTFEGRCDGYIIEEERGTHGFGYDPMFYVPEIDMTFGEAPDDVKHKMSHRYFALLKLSEFIKGLD
jgi:non-canonical purine NTP pyrophosphatase (RdgB/HAM1 family)